MNSHCVAGIVKLMRVILARATDTIEVTGELHLGERRCSAAALKSSHPRRGFSDALRSMPVSIHIRGTEGMGESDE